MITLAPSMTTETEDGMFRVNAVFTVEELAEIEALPHLVGPYDDKIVTLGSGRRVRQYMWKRKNGHIDRVALVAG